MQVLASDRPPAIDRPALLIRRVDAIPVALPLKKPVKMAAETVTHARNILVRVEAADGTVGWGEAASAPTMTGDTLGGLTAAVRDHLAPLLIGADAWVRPALMKRLRTALRGGVPIKVGDETIGAVGVSGGSSEADEKCALAGIAKVADQLK